MPAPAGGTLGHGAPCVCGASSCRECGCTSECVSTSKDQGWKTDVCVCLQVRPWEELAIGETRGVPLAARESVRSGVLKE